MSTSKTTRNADRGRSPIAETAFYFHDRMSRKITALFLQYIDTANIIIIKINLGIWGTFYALAVYLL